MENTLSRDKIVISKEFIETDLAKVSEKVTCLPIIKQENSPWTVEHDTAARGVVLNGIQPDPGNEIKSFHSKVAGVSFRQGVIDTLKENDVLVLEREPNNPADPNAIKILTKDSVQVGYVKADLAAKLSKDIDGGKKYKVTVSQLTGSDKHTKGVNIKFEVI